MRISRRRARVTSSPGSGVRAPCPLPAPRDLQAEHVLASSGGAAGGAAAAGPLPRGAFRMVLLLPEQPRETKGLLHAGSGAACQEASPAALNFSVTAEKRCVALGSLSD